MIFLNDFPRGGLALRFRMRGCKSCGVLDGPLLVLVQLVVFMRRRPTTVGKRSVQAAHKCTGIKKGGYGIRVGKGYWDTYTDEERFEDVFLFASNGTCKAKTWPC